MIITDNSKLYERLRQEYPYFVFEKYEIIYHDVNLTLCFHFNLSDKYFFYPKIEIPINANITDKLSGDALDSLVFHLGLVEMLSYWKATCSPEIIVKPFLLEEPQIRWWKNLFYHGLGEFFYLNHIKPDFKDFLNIKSNGNDVLKKRKFNLQDDLIIPLGGGKDSALTYEILSKTDKDSLIFMLNPQHIALDVLFVKEREPKVISAYRTIDNGLIELNKKGFLNGHTPFSALLAFLNLLISAITKRRNIVLSNESSANESTVYGSSINHQYSKTYAFEKDFRDYVKTHISDDFNYFSFLRPLNELQIAFLFSEHTHFFNFFRSCNAGSKKKIWCGMCPKCLFTYIILSPFIEKEKLVGIFGTDLLDKQSLKPIFDQLTGISEIKPFDCVGTIEDVNLALLMTLKKNKGTTLTCLLKYYAESELYKKYQGYNYQAYLRTYNKENFLNTDFELILKSNLEKRLSMFKL